MVHPPRTLLLSRSTIATLATSADYLSSARAAFIELDERRYQLSEVGHVSAASGAFHIKACARSGSPSLAAVKVNGNYPDNPARHSLPTIQGFIALLDADRGCVLALMDSIEITARRTAAATALAARYLARSESTVAGFVGCGTQARYHLDALLDVVALTTVRFCEPRNDAAEAFAAYARDLGLSAQRVAGPGATSTDADLVVTLTPSREPVLRLADIAPGTFIAGVGADNPAKHELAVDLLCASRVVVDVLAQAAAMGDLHHAIQADAMQTTDIHGELAGLCAGRIAGRSDDTQRFVFDSTGVAALDLAAAAMIYERASSNPNLPHIVLNDVA